MKKVELHYDFMSPFLQRVSGIARIGEIDFGLLDDSNSIKVPFYKESGSLGYKNLHFDSPKPIMDAMIRSYVDGMLMRDFSVFWYHHSRRIDTNNQQKVIVTLFD
jgi:hypothetical protein